jgi:hypothetical protein
MSGGYFDYRQYELKEWADDILRIVKRNEKLLAVPKGSAPPVWADGNYSEYTELELEKLKEAVYYLNKAYIYAERADRLICGDDTGKCFLERLEFDLAKLEEERRWIGLKPSDNYGKEEERSI